MATGKSSKLGASSSRARTKTAKQQEEKRKQQCATRAEQAKKPRRPSQLINVAAAHRHGGGTAAVPVVVPPLLHCAASSSNMATTLAFPFPIAGVNGAGPLWSPAAMLGAASRAAAAFTVVSSLPATAGAADGPAAAPFVLAPAPPGLQLQPDAAAAAVAALALPVTSAATGVVRPPPLVLAQQAGAGAEGQLVPLPLHFVGYYSHTAGGVVSGLPAPAVGIPLAAALDKIENGALARILSALMPVCHPPLRLHQGKRTGAPPPWWPTGSEDWWVPELLAHLDTVAALTLQLHYHAAAPAPTPPVPFAPSYSLKKAQKVALLVAIVKHLAPDFARIAAAVRHAGKLSVSETDLWHSALNNERAKYMRPVFVLLPQAQPEQGGGGAGTPSAAGSVVVVHSGSGSTASDGCEKVAIANLPAGSCASVSSAPAADVSRGEAITAAELVEKEPRRSDIDGGSGGVVSAASDAQAGDGGDQRPFNFPAGDSDGSTHNKQGAAVAAAAPTGHVLEQVVVAGGAPEMTTMQPEPEQLGGVAGGDGDVAPAAAEVDQVQAHLVVDMEEEGHQWWHNSEELNRMFAEFESFGDDVWY